MEIPGSTVSDCFANGPAVKGDPVGSILAANSVQVTSRDEVTAAMDTQESPREAVIAEMVHTDAASVPAAEASGVPSIHGGNSQDEEKVSPKASCHEKPAVGIVAELPIKSSPSQLKTLLQYTGHSLRVLDCAEKLDILNLITEQVKEKVQHGRKMTLSLKDLNTFLDFEGLPHGTDAKSAIGFLLELRQRQLLRLGSHGSMDREASAKAVPSMSDDSFKHALATLPMETVRECFADPSETTSRLQKRSHKGMDAALVDERECPPKSLYRQEAQELETTIEKTEVREFLRIGQSGAPELRELASSIVDQVEAAVSEAPANASLESSLSSELKRLLCADVSDAVLALEDFLEESPATPSDASEDITSQQLEARSEVERILATKEIEKILEGSTPEEQKRHFQKLAKLLHPDKGFVNPEDGRASMALRLALVARKRAGVPKPS